MTERFWESIALRLDAGTRRSDGGRTLLGGSPLRVLRLTDAGARIVDDFVAGSPVGPHRGRQQLARRLLDAGLAHPQPRAHPDVAVAIVVPVRDHARDLQVLLDRLEVDGLPTTVVVDDGSADGRAVLDAVAGRATVVRHARPSGPAAARNTGWRATDADIVVFLDADVSPTDGWFPTVIDHFLDPRVGATAPRIRGRRSSDSVLDRFEEHRSPLDLGPQEARVAPRSRVSYVPTAAIAYRRTVLEQTGGFDESLRVGEDVDLVWRTIEAGHTVRYAPDAVVTHRNRPTWWALACQRATYGTSAAALDRRHPGAVPPVELNVWSLVSWALPAVAGWPGAVAGATTAATTTAALVPKLRGRVDRPVAEALRLGGLGNLWAGRWLAHATVRAWLPLAVVASTRSRPLRRATAAAMVVPALLAWRETDPDLGPFRWTAASLVDDVAYCTGVWRGCWRERSWRCLAPRLSGIPGLTDDRER